VARSLARWLLVVLWGMEGRRRWVTGATRRDGGDVAGAAIFWLSLFFVATRARKAC